MGREERYSFYLYSAHINNCVGRALYKVQLVRINQTAFYSPERSRISQLSFEDEWLARFSSISELLSTHCRQSSFSKYSAVAGGCAMGRIGFWRQETRDPVRIVFSPFDLGADFFLVWSKNWWWWWWCGGGVDSRSVVRLLLR